MYAPGRTSMRVDSNCKNVPKKSAKKGFFVTNLKLCNSFVEVLFFSLEWNNCDTKFYKDDLQNFTKNAKTITAQKTKFEKPQRSKAKPKLIKTTKP